MVWVHTTYMTILALGQQHEGMGLGRGMEELNFFFLNIYFLNKGYLKLI
jgi:hypothetical protein